MHATPTAKVKKVSKNSQVCHDSYSDSAHTRDASFHRARVRAASSSSSLGMSKPPPQQQFAVAGKNILGLGPNVTAFALGFIFFGVYFGSGHLTKRWVMQNAEETPTPPKYFRGTSAPPTSPRPRPRFAPNHASRAIHGMLEDIAHPRLLHSRSRPTASAPVLQMCAS